MDATFYVAMTAVALGTVAIGLYKEKTRATTDFLVASRTLGSRWNAAAVSGEYLSAASFLGIAGLVLKDGVDALWYPVGFTAGYLALLLFVAAPLRRSGAYSLPDFAEVRLGSGPLRRICTAFVVIIGWLYLVPQLQGAGLTVHMVSPYPSWVGAVAVVVIVCFNICTGWVRSITVVQALQYWIKLTVLAVPVFVLLIHQGSGDQKFRDSVAASMGASASPVFSQAVDITLEHDVVLQVTGPIQGTITGLSDGQLATGPISWAPGEHRVGKDARLHFDAGSRVPVISGAAVSNDTWLRPMGSGTHSLLGTYSLIAALLLGTMGLPHMLSRYYADPDGSATRRTTLLVLILLGVFYLFPMASGWLARLYLPRLLVNGNTDAALLLLPGAALDGWPAFLLGGLIAAGAFAAFVSAATGLMMSVAGVMSTDVLPGPLRGVRSSVLASWSVPLAFMLAVSSLDLAQGVGLAFAVAASSFCPLLMLGIWWRGLTGAGAAAGMVLGGGLAFVSVLIAAVGVPSPWWQTLLAQPAVFTAPLAFLTMVVVSRRTSYRVPIDVLYVLLRLHAPDRLGLAKDQELGQLSARVGIAAFLLRMRGGRHRKYYS